MSVRGHIIKKKEIVYSDDVHCDMDISSINSYLANHGVNTNISDYTPSLLEIERDSLEAFLEHLKQEDCDLINEFDCGRKTVQMTNAEVAELMQEWLEEAKTKDIIGIEWF